MILGSINISLNHSGQFSHALSLDRLQCSQFLGSCVGENYAQNHAINYIHSNIIGR